MLVALTGGTGGAKLIEGLSHEVDSAELTIICNTADDFVFHGLNVSPDIDTIIYTLAGMSDSEKGWGVQMTPLVLWRSWKNSVPRRGLSSAIKISRHISYGRICCARASNYPMSRRTAECTWYQSQDSSHVRRRSRDPNRNSGR